MYNCVSTRALRGPYLDGELDVKESLRVQEHLEACAICRREFEEGRRFLQTVRAQWQFLPAPAALRDRIVRALAAEQAKGRQTWRRGAALAASVLLVMGGGLLLALWLSDRAAPGVPPRVDFFTREHLGHLRGEGRLGVVSADPAVVSAWFEGKLPVRVFLPGYATEKLRLLGGGLVLNGETPLAHILYEVGGAMVSLFVASPAEAMTSGEEIVLFREITFHQFRHRGYLIQSWVDHGLSYSLVSPVGAKGKEACLVCHSEGLRLEEIRGVYQKL